MAGLASGGSVAVTAEDFIDAPPVEVFARFGADSDAGWLFGASCDRLAAGAFISMRIPLGGAGPVDIFGRVSGVRPPEAIDISHDQPWRGRVRIRFAPVSAGTRVRVHAEVDTGGIEWLMRRQGLPVPRSEARGPRVGLITSKSGSGSLFAAASQNLAALAVEEINADGGVDGYPVELLVADDETDPATGVREAHRLIRAGCRTIFVMTTSATYDAVSTALWASPTLIVQPQMSEGGPAHPLRLEFGERPREQVLAAARPLMKLADGNRWFLAGNSYSWPRRVNSVAHSLLPDLGGCIVGESYASLGTEDFSELIDKIQSSKADIVLNTFVGADAAAFERRCYAMGLRNRALSLGPAMDESTLARIGTEASVGIYGVSAYYQGLQTVGNDRLIARYRNVFGRWAPPLSTLSEAVFEGLTVWGSAARSAGGSEPQRIAEQIRSSTYDLPRGRVALSDHGSVGRHLYLAEAHGGTFDALLPLDVTS
ncbi:UNVERIFIED_CONTAM: amino acid/amide ABC transporter substrate-binding protein (HAAT family) [Williamsia faeni]